MATTELERLIVSLEASTTKYERALARAYGQTNNGMRRIEQRVSKMSGGVERAFGKAFGAFSAGFAAKAAVNLVDASIKIENALKIAGLQGEELQKVYNQLFASAQRNAAPLEALATLYGRVAQVQKELGIDTERLAKFTDNVAIALRVSGRTAEESRGALLQLGQALGGTIVRAEEFNSINEGALPILQAVARGLKEAGGSVAQLRTLVINGEVPSKAFFDAFEAGASTLQDKVATAEFTVSQGFTRLMNVLVDTAGNINDATGASDALVGGLDVLAATVQKVGQAFRDNKQPINDFFDTIQTKVDETNQFLKGKRQDNGETTFFEPIDFNALGAWVLGLFGNAANPEVTFPSNPGDLPVPSVPVGTRVGTQILGPPRPAATPARPLTAAEKLFREADSASVAALTKPVSLKDYSTDTDKDTKAIERQKQAVKDLIADLEFEKSLIGLTELEQKKLTAARDAGAVATEEQKQQIMDLTEEIYKEQEAIDYLNELYNTLSDIARSTLDGIIDAFADGKIEAQEFGDIISNVLSMLGNFFLNQAFGNGSNGFSSILQGLFGGGRAMGGPVEKGKIYKVNENTPNSEYFAPGEDGMIIPRLPTASSGDQSSAAPVFNIDARGAQRGVADEIRRAMEEFSRYTLPTRVKQINKDPLARG